MNNCSPVAGTQSQLTSSDTKNKKTIGLAENPCLYREHRLV